MLSFFKFVFSIELICGNALVSIFVCKQGGSSFLINSFVTTTNFLLGGFILGVEEIKKMKQVE
jgi:hypothetical protein